MRIHSKIRFVIALAALVGICGCGTQPQWKRQMFAFAGPEDAPTAPTSTNICSLAHVIVSAPFQSLSFTYRKSENGYEADPYACFMVAPERALAGPIRASLRQSGAFGRVVEPRSSLVPSTIVEASVTELYGDLRQTNEAAGVLSVHFIVYEDGPEGPGRVVLDKSFSGRTPMSRKAPAALMVAWDADLRKIMKELSSEYAKANSNDR